MTTTIEPGTFPAPAPAPVRPVLAPAASEAAPPSRDAAPVTPDSAPPAVRPWSAQAMRALIISAGACAAVIAAIGFVGSYDALRGLAERRGFGTYALVFPIGIDAGILAMYALDLILVWRRMPKPVLRLFAHVLTLATIVFNAHAGEKSPAEDPLAAAMHGVLPLLFVAVVEAARHLVIRSNGLSLAAESDRVPLHRWLLAPWSAWTLYRRMKLFGVSSYAQMVAMEKARTVYRAWLQHKYGRSWKRKAGAEAMLPFTMAPFGLSVDQALALPQEQKEAAAVRKAMESAAEAAAAEREEQRVLEEEERRARAVVRRLEIGAEVTTAEHRIGAQTIAAGAEARAAQATSKAQAEAAEVTARAEAEAHAHAAQLAAEATRRAAERAATEAERTAEREAEAGRSQAEAEALARAEAARRNAAEDRRKTATATAEAAAKERKAAEDRRAAAEADRNAKSAAADAAALAEREANAARLAAEHREATERAELAAQEAEDAARLSSRERAERRVGRMILAAGGDERAVPLADIETELNVGRTVASERRQAAAALIAGGYTG
ncbi:DUF2637 domain-containing protein [Streptomyces xanthophaeus]|uniref:DUF2637 domain-containing protein n=1 Tax=Streptomyces xanthophaeus TaxID=67385 RepID=UPI00371E550C